jgi:hypothetical protein
MHIVPNRRYVVIVTVAHDLPSMRWCRRISRRDGVAGVEVRADGRVMSFFADFTYEASRGIIGPCRQPTRTVTRA